MLKRLKRIIAAALTLAAGIIGLRECFLFGGLAVLAYGLALIYPPAAWIVVGLVLMALALRQRGPE